MIKKAIQAAARPFLSKFGLSLVPSSFIARSPGYHRLARIPDVQTVIDVGVGDQGSPFLYRRFPDAFFISIDPLHESRAAVKKYLRADRSLFLETALGSAPGLTQIAVSSKPSRTSLLQRLSHDEFSRVVETREISVTTLDLLVKTSTVMQGAFNTPILLKIDTEGYELECLKGGTEALRSIDYVLLELPLTENFHGSYRFSEAIALMAEYGFEAFQILRAGDNSADLLFVRREDDLRRRLSYGSR